MLVAYLQEKDYEAAKAGPSEELGSIGSRKFRSRRVRRVGVDGFLNFGPRRQIELVGGFQMAKMVEELQLPDASNLPSREGLRTAKADPSEELGSMASRKFGLGSFQKASNNVEGRPDNKVGVPAFWA